MKKIRFGIFGDGEVEMDNDGFIEIPVIIEASGLYGGAPPPELRIRERGIYGNDEFNKRYVAKLNRKADLPLFLATAKIKILPGMEQWTDEKLTKNNIQPLKQKSAL